MKFNSVFKGLNRRLGGSESRSGWVRKENDIPALWKSNYDS